MSNTVKLSELLENGADALDIYAYEFMSTRSENEAKAIRAIAPALVELAASMCAFNAEMGIAEVQSASTRRDKAQEAFYDAMKAAGVTCE